VPRTDRGRLDFPALADYFRRGFRPRETWLVGMEVEKMGVTAADGSPIPYEGNAASVRSVLERILADRGGDPVYEGDHLVGVEGSWGALSLEPGGQVEWSSRPARDLAGLGASLRQHLEAMDRVAASLGIRWIDRALHPDVPLSEMPWMPKARYAIMRSHLGARGRLAHRMMTQTASVQCAFDFADERDWARRFRAAAFLAPVVTALFANSSRMDGRETGWLSYRRAIWDETDPARCGLPAVVFDPGFDIEAWTRWAVEVPTIFFRREAGLLPSHGEAFALLLSRCGCDAMTQEDWELHLSTIFTEVRSYTYIEARSADLPPDPLLLAVPTFWVGTLYHDAVLDAVFSLSNGFATHDGWREAMAEAGRLGLEGFAGGRRIRERAAEALGLAAWGLRHGAACVGNGGDPAAPLDDLAARHGLTLREIAA
jgi:glutamate--cysteine ligase